MSTLTPKVPTVVVRIRHQDKVDDSSHIQLFNNYTAIAIDTRDANASHNRNPVGGRANEEKLTKHSFDAIFPPKTTQEEVYNNTAKKYVDDALNGMSSTIFGYGQSCSGKTYTLTGSLTATNNNSNPTKNTTTGTPFHLDPTAGVTPRAIVDLFSQAQDHPQYDYIFTCTYLEIDGRVVRDLLLDKPRNAGEDYNVVQRPTKLIFDSARHFHVATPQEAFDRMNAGVNRRKVRATDMNAQSSRSHACFSLHIHAVAKRSGPPPQNLIDAIVKRPIAPQAQIALTSSFNFLDLAGSERFGSTGAATDAKIKDEGIAINTSLSILGRCIQALVKKERPPFNETPLTKCFQDLLTKGQLCLIIAVSPLPKNKAESANSVVFGSAARALPPPDPKKLVRELQPCENDDDITHNNKRQKGAPTKEEILASQEYVQLQSRYDAMLEQSFQRGLLLTSLYEKLRKHITTHTPPDGSDDNMSH